MTGVSPSRIWKEQCEASMTIRTRFGCHAAFEYIVLEKLSAFFDAATTHTTFARELPSFIAAVREIFTTAELQSEFARFEFALQQTDEEGVGAELDSDPDEVFSEPIEVVMARSNRFTLIKQLLLSPQLGTA
jgi:hypothetical protein